MFQWKLLLLLVVGNGGSRGSSIVHTRHRGFCSGLLNCGNRCDGDTEGVCVATYDSVGELLMNWELGVLMVFLRKYRSNP